MRVNGGWRKVLRGLGWLWLSLPLLLPALLLLWAWGQHIVTGSDIGWAVVSSNQPLDWLWGLLLWLGPGLALLWFGRRGQPT